jgi:membrane protein
MFADPANLSVNLESVSGLLPQGATDVIRDQMTRIAHGTSTLSLTFLAGLAVSLWSANAGVKSMFDALNLVYNEEEKRGLIKLNLVSLAFTAAAILFLIVALAALVVLPVMLNYIGLGSVIGWIATLGSWPVLLVVVGFALAALYRYGPSRREPKWRRISWGSGSAAVVWIVMSVLFSWYAANFGNYNATYGSLGAVIGFMIWMWLSIIVVLLGAEINAEMEHQTACDTTIGAPKPLGARRAVMADTVGAAQ